jgi:hypothetical protein
MTGGLSHRRFSTRSGELRMVPVRLVLTAGVATIVEFEEGKFATLGARAPGQPPLMSLD